MAFECHPASLLPSAPLGRHFDQPVEDLALVEIDSERLLKAANDQRIGISGLILDSVTIRVRRRFETHVAGMANDSPVAVGIDIFAQAIEIPGFPVGARILAELTEHDVAVLEFAD